MVVYTLHSTGFEAEGLPDGAALFEAIGRVRPQLILLDIMLPGEDGLTILRQLRAAPATAEIPVILATARGTEYDKVTGLDQGADDYLAKPFGMMEMVSRVKAVLRRTAPRQEQQLLRAGALSLNLGEHTVAVDGQRVTLTLKEFEVLRVMMENIGQVFTRDRLLGEIWGYDLTARRAPWTSTCAPFARSWAAAATTLRRSAASATDWRWSTRDETHFRSIFLVALAVLLVCTVLIMSILYGYFNDEQHAQLRAQTDLAAQAWTPWGRRTSPRSAPTGTASRGSPPTARCSTTPTPTPAAWRTT